MKRLLRGRVFLNGEEISTDVMGLDIRVRPNEVLTCTVELYVNDITKDQDGSLVYWLGTREMYIEGMECPLKTCNLTHPHLHTAAEMKDKVNDCE